MKLGILGPGHLAGFLIEGWINSGRAGSDIILSPRGQADLFAERFGAQVAASNADVVEKTNTVILSVRPDMAADAIKNLPWTSSHCLISVCAGVQRKELEAATPAAIVRAMPIAAAAFGRSPTPYFPENDQAAELLSVFGTVIPMPTEEQFEAVSIGGAIFGWYVSLIAETASIFEANSIPEGVGETLSAGLMEAAGAVCTVQPGPKPSDIMKTLATPGGITEAGLAALRDNGFWEKWQEAYEAAVKKIENSQPD